MVTLDALRQRIVEYYGTVRHFAEDMGFSESTLSLMLNGKRKIMPDWRRMMGKALDIGERDFLRYFGGSDKEFYVIDCGDIQYGEYDTLVDALKVFQYEKDGIRVLKRTQLDEVVYRRKK